MALLNKLSKLLSFTEVGPSGNNTSSHRKSVTADCQNKRTTVQSELWWSLSTHESLPNKYDEGIATNINMLNYAEVLNKAKCCAGTSKRSSSLDSTFVYVALWHDKILHIVHAVENSQRDLDHRVLCAFLCYLGKGYYLWNAVLSGNKGDHREASYC